MLANQGRTLGQHLASRLVEIGVDDFYAVPGDYNLLLLDELLKEPKLRMINTCNELNAGYAADGYARAKGVGCAVVTFTVGGLSLINAVAGMYSENLPCIIISGGPNSNDFGTSRVLHHTIGEPDFNQELRMFKEVTCAQVQITDVGSAFEMLDHAITEALQHNKPAYISVCCNLPNIPHPMFDRVPVPYSIDVHTTNQRALEAAVEDAVDFLSKAVRPVIVGGVKMRVGKAGGAFMELVDASKYPLAVMPNAKGLVPETHTRFMGTYWGAVSTPLCGEMVESADAYIFVGPIFNDYSSVGYSMLIKAEKMIRVEPFRVTIADARTYGCVNMADFLRSLAKKITPNDTAWANYQRMWVPSGEVPRSPPDTPLQTKVLYKHVQDMLTANHAVLAETGDAWFNCQKLKLPEGCGFEFQMQYGSIGWSVGALLGYATALAKKAKRVVACIGDGSFQVTAQDISTIIRYNLNPIVFLINNAGYTIEVEIHDGPYNNIKMWDYAGLVRAMHNGEGKAWAVKVTTEEELEAAVETAQGEHADSFCFIECIIHRDDCSKELLEWGSRVATANGRRPNPQ